MSRLFCFAVIVSLALSLSFASACGKNGDGAGADASTNDDASRDAAQSTDAGGDSSPQADMSSPPDGSAPDAAGDVGTPDGGDSGAPDMMTGSLEESEPNDGTTLDEVDDLAPGQSISGTIDVGDSDVFAVETGAGKVYEVSLAVQRGSELQPHLTVLDDGRDGEAAGGDYVKIVRGPSMQFLAMGEGGHLVVVRHARNVDGGAEGGDDYGYVLRVDEIPQGDVTQGPVTFGGTLSGTLAGPGDVHLWSFDGTNGMDVVFDMNAPDADGRLYIFADETGSWIARQDDRTAGDPNPLIDAPLFAAGLMYLVVENIAEDASNIAYTVEASAP